MSEKSFREKIEGRLHSWKRELEELQLQLHLGSKEAAEKLEEQKNNLRSWMDDNRGRFKEVEEEIGEEAREFRQKFNELLEKLKKAPAETKEAAKAQEAELSATMDELKVEAEKLEEQGSESAAGMMDDFQDRMSRFQAHLKVLTAKYL